MDRSVWDIEETELSDSSSIETKIRFWLRYAVLAPSAHNTQPWKWTIDNARLQIWRDEQHTLGDSDPTLRETFLSLGAFIENFVVAAAHWHHGVTITNVARRTSDLLIAEILVESGINSDISSLFSGITKRHTNRGLYKQIELPQNVLKRLIVPTEKGVKEFMIIDSRTKKHIAELVGKGTTIALSMRRMKQELVNLISRERDQKDTGMVVEALSEEAPAGASGAKWVRDHLDPLKEGQMWEKSFAVSPVHIVIGSECDGAEDWLAAGRVMERVLLQAAALDLAHCISAGPVEIPTLVPSLRACIDSAYRPQVLVRLGYPINQSFTRNSTRRSIV